jgi:hypothetical protein
MNCRTHVPAALAAFALVIGTMQSAAAAVIPKVSGVYAFMSWSLCEARFTTTTNNYRLANGNTAPAVTTVNPQSSGLLEVIVGTIAFPNTAASSGNATLRMVQIEGGSLQINSSQFPMRRVLRNQTGTFSLTETTFTFAGMSFDMTYGDFVNEVARTVYLVRIEDSNCLNAISATKR